MTKVKVKTRRERRKRRYGTGQGNKERMNKDIRSWIGEKETLYLTENPSFSIVSIFLKNTFR